MVAFHSTLSGLYDQQGSYYGAPSGSYTTLVLVTGAHQGIGFEIAKRLGTENPDYHILLAGRKKEPLAKAVAKLQHLNCSVEGLPLDVTSDESIAQAARVVGSKFGRLDVLINNAGVSSSSAGSSRDQWTGIFHTNVFGVHGVTEAFLPLLDASEATKRIVNVSSGLGSLRLKTDRNHPNHHTNNFSLYSTSRTALNMLTLHYVNQFEEDPSWKINLCCPGFASSALNSSRTSQDVEDGAVNACRLATLGPDGETGTFSDQHGIIPW